MSFVATSALRGTSACSRRLLLPSSDILVVGDKADKVDDLTNGYTSPSASISRALAQRRFA